VGALPLRDGVGASHVQVLPSPSRTPRTLIEFFCAQFPAISEAVWRERFARGLVQDRAGLARRPDDLAQTGLDLYYWREVEAEPAVPLDAPVLYQDAQLVVADKPHFLPVVPAGPYVRHCLLAQLRRTLDLPDLVPLHRIDRATAGVVLFSCSAALRARYQALFPQRAVVKQYEALAPHREALLHGLVHRSRIERGEPFFRMRETTGAPNSETRIAIGERRGALSLYRLVPVTGRKHQLRVHMAALGAPILHDPLYPELRAEPAGDDPQRPLKLLARAIEFVDPLSGALRRFTSTRRL
jgi:tRNA pseudouridine32 synthase / 23S rRNA pseudouridine746 synthase